MISKFNRLITTGQASCVWLLASSFPGSQDCSNVEWFLELPWFSVSITQKEEWH
jgi:hypothetical protein